MNLEEKLVKKLSKPIDDATDKEIYEACVDLVQDEIISKCDGQVLIEEGDVGYFFL